MGAGQWLSFGPSKFVGFVSFLYCSLSFTNPTDIAQASAAANRILDLRHTDDADGRLVSLDIGDLGAEDQGVKIEFKDVWFRYPTRDAPVLNGLNMTVGTAFLDGYQCHMSANRIDRERTVRCRGGLLGLR